MSPSEMLPCPRRGQYDGREGNLVYHNSLVVQYWRARRTRDVGLMTHVLPAHFPTTLVNATCASLSGPERETRGGEGPVIDRAVQRIHMGHALITELGGITLIWMGDELALTSDLCDTANPDRTHDCRWLHRPG